MHTYYMNRMQHEQQKIKAASLFNYLKKKH